MGRGLARPLVHHPQRVGRLAFEQPCRFQLRQRNALERDFRQHAERPQRAGQKSRQIEACDVLHHAAAERKILAAAVEHPHPEHDVPQRPRVGTAGARQAGGNGAA
jgi:hypothetical protein